MAESEGQRERRRRKRVKDRKRPPEPGNDTAAHGEPDVIPALSHVVRREILRLLHRSNQPRSPARTAEELERSLGTVSYHFRVLLLCGIVAAVREAQVRGVIEHFYSSKVADDPMVIDMLDKTRKADEGLMCRDAEA